MVDNRVVETLQCRLQEFVKVGFAYEPKQFKAVTIGRHRFMTIRSTGCLVKLIPNNS